MIVYDLHCRNGHRFEGWFGSSDDYNAQRSGGMIACPECGTSEVDKAPMAPAVPAKGNTASQAIVMSDDQPAQDLSNAPMPAEVQKALTELAKAQAKALEKSTYVGDTFAEKSREMHYGERDEKPIHGQASLEEAKALVDEGVPIAPLPFPVAPPDKLN
ncbi:MAG: DUF1178 family protein [Pseudomonadota bacterium]